MKIEEITIDELHHGYQQKSWTCREVVTAFLARIDQLDKAGPMIQSTLALSTTVLEEADALDKQYNETGAFAGALHGVPTLVKDQVDTAGIETMYGSIRCKGNIPDQDATAVRKLKMAGALILGKTTMCEWATTWFSMSSVSDFQPTRNPYNLVHDVGGSSSGSAASIAANFAVLALGEDTGGSIRLPASFCNIVGLRPTPGLVSRSGFCPLIKTTDTPGPMARTVHDCALMMDSLVGYDPGDDYTVAATIAGPPAGGSYAVGLEAAFITRSRIGVVTSMFGSDDDPYCSQVNLVVRKALQKLATQGTVLVEIDIPDAQAYITRTLTYLTRSRADVNSFLATKPMLPDDIAEIVPESPPHPTLAGTCKIMHGPKDPFQDEQYAQRLLLRDEFHRLVVGIMAKNQLHALAFPDVQVPPPTHADAVNNRFPDVFKFPTNTLFASQTRMPAISVPVGFTENGLPVGLELVSWDYSEQTLFQLAFGVEQAVGARRPPQLT